MENKLVLWDIDGTLMHCGSDGTKALNSAFMELYSIENAFMGVGIGGAMDSTVLSKVALTHNIEESDFNDIKQQFARELKKILADDKQKRILPGVREIIEYIEKSEDIFQGILTSNFKVGAEIKLESVGLSEIFEVGVYGECNGEKWNGALEAIAKAESVFGRKFDIKNIFNIGDSRYDVECAKKIGSVSIGVATGWMDYQTLKKFEPDYLFDDLSNYEQIIKILTK